MNPTIVDTALEVTVHGFSGTAAEGCQAETAFKLMDRMWQNVKSFQLKNKGLNIWVYEPGRRIFAGVELEAKPDALTGLEEKQIHLQKYATHTHTGPYSLIKQAGQQMEKELLQAGHETVLPYIEIYGHWTNDESKLQTQLIMALK